MSKRQVQWVALCEDRQQEVFVRRLLDVLGFDKRKVRVRTSPPARGAADQFVLKQYAVEVDVFRKRQPQFWGLVVLLDADTRDAAERHQQLSQQLDAAGLAPRSASERIVVLVPRRNIETWIHYLLGNDVNELDDFKQHYTGKPERTHCEPAARRLARFVQGTEPVPPDCPQSLRTAINELKLRL